MLSISRTSCLKQGLLFSLIAAISLTGCSSARKIPSPQTPGNPNGEHSERMGPPPPPSAVNASRETYGPSVNLGASPETPKSHSGKVVIAFGPGYARGFAASGVIRKLNELKIPISRIYAHEVSALVSAIHAVSPNANRVEWAFLKFNDVPLARDKPRKFSLTAGSESDVDDRLMELFSQLRMETLRPSLRIAEYTEPSGSLQWVSDGEVRKAVRASLGGQALGIKPIEKPATVFGRGPHLLEFLKSVDSRENDPVIFVLFSPLTPEENAFIQHTGALRITVSLNEVSETDFKKRNLAVFRGKEAVERMKPQIFRLIDRTDVNSETDVTSP